MIRLDVSYFLRLAAQLARLRFVNLGSKIGSLRGQLSEARAWIDSFGRQAMFGSSGFRTAKIQIPALIGQLDMLLGKDDEAEFDFDAYLNLINPLNNFENALLSESAMADVYYVLEKDPYSTLALATKGESLFPPQTLLKVPEAFDDLQAAGKCIAFELPTAAAFHIHRATEAVLRRYWTAVAGNVPKPKLRTIGVFLAALRKHELGDGKVVAALGQMNELHRNPTIHPEDNLTLDEAIALLGIANSVVASMLKEIPDVIPNEPELPGLGELAKIFGLPPGDEQAA